MWINFDQLLDLPNVTGVNYINVLCASSFFEHSTDPESAKKSDNLTVFLGSEGVKAARKTLVKSTPVQL